MLPQTSAIPHINEDHKLFKKILILASRHIIINTYGKKRDKKSLNGQGSVSQGHCFELREKNLFFSAKHIIVGHELWSYNVQSVSSF